MKKIMVRCWQVENRRLATVVVDQLYITYPEGNAGHELITCKNCGEIYAITVAKKVYIGPKLDEKIAGIECMECGVQLQGNYAFYPDQYYKNGAMHRFHRDTLIPDDCESIVEEFYGIYD